jgi:hypothetical protein
MRPRCDWQSPTVQSRSHLFGRADQQMRQSSVFERLEWTAREVAGRCENETERMIETQRLREFAIECRVRVM